MRLEFGKPIPGLCAKLTMSGQGQAVAWLGGCPKVRQHYEFRCHIEMARAGGAVFEIILQ